MLRSLIGNFPLKVLALCLSVVIWFIVSAPRRERVVELPFDVPLALVAVPKDLVVTTAIRETVNARLRGRLSVLRSFSSQNLAATIDLSELRGGDWTLNLTPQQLNLPPGVEVVSLDPTTVKIRLDPRRQKVVPIRPFLLGELPAGYVMDGVPLVSPGSVLLSGPASLIRDVSEVATERIILTGRTAPFRATVGLVSENSLVAVVEPVSAQVSISVISEARLLDESGRSSAVTRSNPEEKKR